MRHTSMGLTDYSESWKVDVKMPQLNEKFVVQPFDIKIASTPMLQ